ncbi:MAG: hypothetical protein AVDCRST_MAG37-635, partial [uncultured Rubrobacteraceae bacterium]
ERVLHRGRGGLGGLRRRRAALRECGSRSARRRNRRDSSPREEETVL